MNWETDITDLTGGLTEADCNGNIKAQITQKISAYIAKYIPLPQHAYNSKQLNTLQTDGITPLENVAITPTQVTDIVTYLKQIPVFNGHVPSRSDGVARKIETGARAFP